MDYFVVSFGKALSLLLGGDPETYSALRTTLWVSTTSLIMSLLGGVPLGFLLGYASFPGRRFLRTLVDTLLSLPTVLIGLLVYGLLTHHGPLGRFGLLFTVHAIIIGQTLLALPIVIALTASAVEALDERLHVTLLSLGAGRWRRFLTSVREARFGLLTASVTAYGRVLTEVGIAIMVGGNIKWHTRTLTTAIALETNKGDFASGVALGLILLSLAFLVNIALYGLRKRV
ncbi:MAG: ABC transporter permease [Desulfosoma sp.]